MNIQIHTTHINLSDTQKEYITEKISNLGKYGKQIDDEATLVHVDVKKLDHVNKKEKVEIDIRMKVPGGDFFVQETGITPEETIDKAVLKFRHQIERYKDKKDHLHDGGIGEEV